METGTPAEKSPPDAFDPAPLVDAIKELNISRRNVGLYPRNHPQTKDSTGKALRFLQKLFESRGSITLGIARDSIMIDETILDKKSPVLREFALGLSGKGITSITLDSTLTIEDLFSFHELFTERDTLMGTALVELAEQRNLRNIRLSPLDLSKIRFVQGILRKDSADHSFWTDYISALLDGRLTTDDMNDIIASVTPGEMSDFVNRNMPGDGSEKAYDAVISSYMGGTAEKKRRAVLFGRFLAMVDRLDPDVKQQFLTRALAFSTMDMKDVEKMLRDLAVDDVQTMMKIFEEQSHLIPDRLKNLVDRLQATESDIFAEIRGSGICHMDDIEVDKGMVAVFKKDHDSAFVDMGYRKELQKMMAGPAVRSDTVTQELGDACTGEVVDKTVSLIVFELLDLESNSPEEYRKLLASLIALVNGFVETGRFSEIADIYQTIDTRARSGIFRKEALEMIKGFFGSEMFLGRLMESFRIWGRHNREGVANLAIVLKNHVIPGFLDALSTEENQATRKFFIDVLCMLGDDVAAEAAKRLDDRRWYVTRNMLFLIRECSGQKFIKRLRQFTRHPDERVAIEAVKALLSFGSPDSVSYIRNYLHSKDPGLREKAVRLAGTYKVKGALPDLLELLGHKDVFGSQSVSRLDVVHALGEIGDPSALPALQALYKARALLHRAEFERLKVDIFRSLHHYPFPEAKPLLELGLKSKNKDIRALSEKLLKAGGGHHV
ncbi:MAG: HEAT repeat domain-containing protein [Thermodesulfovibrionales bacterium]|jgi:hypothetical protein